MKTEVRKVYRCDHCKKTMLSAGSMSRHEKYCKTNPSNMHKCFEFCRYLERRRLITRSAYAETQFSCLKTGERMYSFLLEKKKSIWPYHIKLDGMTRMPLKCNMFKTMSYDEIEGRYSPNDED